MPTERKLVRVLDLLTTASLEAAPERIAQPVFRVRDILGSNNIVGVGVAEKTTSGKKTGELAICFYVQRKVALKKLDEAEKIPTAIPASPASSAVATDVIEIGKLHLDGGTKKAVANATRVKLVPGGSVGHQKVTSGTLGAFVTRSGKCEMLSASHVLALSGKAKVGDGILSPAEQDGGIYPADVVARLSGFKQFVSGGSFVNTVDCATATIDAAYLAGCKVAIPGVGLPMGTIAPARDMKIVKVGHASNRTVGVIRDVHFRFVFTYEGIGQVGFLDQVLCTRYSTPGDSGSLVLDRATNRAVGLHFAGAPQGSVFCPIGPVLKALGVKLLTKELA